MSKFVLIDDDKAYGLIMKKTAQTLDLELDVYESLEQMNSIGKFIHYDGVIVDYDLGSMTGVEIGQYLAALFKELPVILISYQYREPKEKWPQSIKGFFHKEKGHKEILSALKTCQESAA